jgi:hypothetical protein
LKSSATSAVKRIMPLVKSGLEPWKKSRFFPRRLERLAIAPSIASISAILGGQASAAFDQETCSRWSVKGFNLADGHLRNDEPA